MILFCVSKYRNNFNIKNIDCCIFLDKIHNRSTDVFINTINKIVKNNKCIIIDKYINNINDIIINIFKYYLILLNLSLLNNNKSEIYKNFINSLVFDKENNIIILIIENNNINFNINYDINEINIENILKNLLYL